MDKLLTLGIDPWAIVIYLGNTGLIIAVLTYLLYKPILGILDKRREIISSSIDEASKLQSAFEKTLEKAEEKNKATEQRLKEELENMHKYTEAKRAELMAEIDKTRTEMLEKTNMEIAKKRESLLSDAEKDIKTLMAKIILDIVENKVPEAVISESITSGWKKYSK